MPHAAEFRGRRSAVRRGSVTAVALLAIMLAGCGTAEPVAVEPEPVTAPPTGTAPFRYAGVAKTLAVGTFFVDIMDLLVPPRLTELSEKLKAGVAQNPQWFFEHSQKTPAGQAMAYDAKLGISEAEYAEFLSLAESQKLRKVARVPMTVTALPGGRLRLDGGKGLPELTGLEVDPVADTVTTPFGATGPSVPVEPDPPRLTYAGQRWSAESLDAESQAGKTVGFTLGTQVDTGRSVLFYRVRVVNMKTGQTDRVDRALEFDPPRPAAAN